MAQIDINNILMFEATAGQYDTQAGRLEDGADEMRKPCSIPAGGIFGRDLMVTALNAAHISAADKIMTAMRGFQAYSGALKTIGAESRNTMEVTVGLLGSTLNAYERADQATPGGN
ncbi:hypothetical protein EV646_112290 [Kribbella antiqua]|uniref:Excreted virulence factor EspC (Type VII ESX diderm) n=1 Tax=Kribbella antiqua TaxID=2512217 RepID=A0A4R2IHI4_9ACTN|nr:hypothetical protein [Kribbella antiqua]TCO43712.1 hypothetical protein EV646_112290 [Kribbella antiqua]